LARDVARLNASISADARNLADLYSRAAYARGELPDAARDQLRSLWRAMRQPDVPRGAATPGRAPLRGG
jgi:hypothetical protein